jgi:LuxR family maltose regulon positive regulatory protein
LPLDEAVGAGRAALARGAWLAARTQFARALAAATTPAALEGLSWSAWWLEDASACVEARERAYRLYREAGDLRSAARMALWLGDDHNEFLGASAVAEGWFHRAARILDELESCPEQGWLTVFEAHAALGRHDTAAARHPRERPGRNGSPHGRRDAECLGASKHPPTQQP